MIQDTERKLYRIIHNSAIKGTLIDLEHLEQFSGHKQKNIKKALSNLVNTGKIPHWLKRMIDTQNHMHTPTSEERYYKWLVGKK